MSVNGVNSGNIPKKNIAIEQLNRMPNRGGESKNIENRTKNSIFDEGNKNIDGDLAAPSLEEMMRATLTDAELLEGLEEMKNKTLESDDCQVKNNDTVSE